jgi:hypothetical protein
MLIKGEKEQQKEGMKERETKGKTCTHKSHIYIYKKQPYLIYLYK